MHEHPARAGEGGVPGGAQAGREAGQCNTNVVIKMLIIVIINFFIKTAIIIPNIISSCIIIIIIITMQVCAPVPKEVEKEECKQVDSHHTDYNESMISNMIMIMIMINDHHSLITIVTPRLPAKLSQQSASKSRDKTR